MAAPAMVRERASSLWMTALSIALAVIPALALHAGCSPSSDEADTEVGGAVDVGGRGESQGKPDAAFPHDSGNDRSSVADSGPGGGGEPAVDAGPTDGGAGPDAGGHADCREGPLPAPRPGCAPEPPPSTGDPYEDCVRRINQLRWECQCLPPLERWRGGEDCADAHAAYDVDREAHSGFLDEICEPRGLAQNECPGWPSESVANDDCLQRMWDEGPGPRPAHGHYLTMSSARYTEVACGFHETSDGRVWAVQNFR